MTIIKHLQQLLHSEMEKKYGVSLMKLQELKKFQMQNRKKRLKMVDIVGTVSVIFKMNNEDASLLLNSNLTIDENNIIAKRAGITEHIPFSQILVYSVSNLTIKIQFKPNYPMDTCILHLQTAEQEEQILNVIPQIQRPLIDHENSSSSSSDFNDSGQSKTSCLHNVDSDSSDELDL